MDIPIQIGFPNKKGVLITHEGNEDFAQNFGDLLVEVEISAHETFQRIGNDLHMTKTLALIDSLSGFQFEIKLLSEKIIVVKSPPGKIVVHGEKMKIPQMGMPLMEDQFTQGNLVITFHVEMP